MIRPVSAFLLASVLGVAQTPKDVRAVAKQGPSAIPTVAQYLNSQSVDTRVETIKQLIALGGKDTIDPLIRGTRDADPEVQIRATDGLVNYYLPGYVKQGLGSTVVRAGVALKARFSDSNDQVIDAFVIVRPDVITALGQLARGGSSMDARANACRAVGILRGQAAVPDLLEALRTKDNRVMYEALAAIQKTRDREAGPRVAYLVRDLDDKVQSAAIETVGLLRTKDALPSLRNIIANPRNKNAERSALAALALMPDPGDRPLLLSYINAKEDKMRAFAAEGLGRIGDPADQPALERVWR
ncbi:MAG: HEAT repeat domain-containing protein, partial [Acidobacteriota bacterium]